MIEKDIEKWISFVEEIPKAKRRGKPKEKYDQMYNAIISSEEGTKGKLKINPEECANVRSALISRRNRDMNKPNFRPFLLFVRNPKRKNKKLVSGELYFERISVEKWKEKEKEREERKRKKAKN